MIDREIDFSREDFFVIAFVSRRWQLYRAKQSFTGRSMDESAAALTQFTSRAPRGPLHPMRSPMREVYALWHVLLFLSSLTVFAVTQCVGLLTARRFGVFCRIMKVSAHCCVMAWLQQQLAI